jgi:outer membrane lipoprotein-sorting protein
MFLMALLFLSSFSTLRSSAKEKRETLSADQILRKSIQIHPKLKDYSSEVTIKALITCSSIHTSQLLQGAYLYKYPGKCRITIKNQPSLLARYPQVFQMKLPNPDEYKCRIRGEETHDDTSFYVVEMTPRQKRGELKRHCVWVNRHDFTRPREEILYANGGKVTINATFSAIQGFMLYKIVKSHVEFPSARLNGYVEMVHKNHRVNCGLTDEMFRE